MTKAVDKALHGDATTEDSKYDLFVQAHGKALRTLAGLRDEDRALRHFVKHYLLLEGCAHVRTWFFLRHVELSMRQKNATVREEAAAFFLLDAAADAA